MMLAHLTMRGLGPHASVDLDLDPTGTTEVSGPSESGKSSLVEGLCFALWGTGSDGRPIDVAAIRDGVDEVAVDATLKSGTTCSRTMTRDRVIERAVTKLVDGEPVQTTYDTEVLWRAQLGRLGKDAEACRMVIAPLAWLALANGPGHGRPLRDALAAVLPPGDLRAEVARLMEEAGQDLRDRDPLEPKAAESNRRDLNRARDVAQGRQDEAQRHLDALHAAEPAAELTEPTEAKATIALGDRWNAYDAKRANHDLAAANHDAAVNALTSWQQRRAELGEKPSASREGAQLEARAAVEKQERAARDLRAAAAAAQAEIGTAEWKVTEAERAEDSELTKARQALGAASLRVTELDAAGDACPTCHRSGWEQAAKSLQLARDTATNAGAYATRLAGTADARKAGAVARARVAVEDARKTHAAAVETLGIGEARVEELRAALAAADEQRRAVKAWTDRLSSLGTEPRVPPPARTPPVEPSTARPSGDDVRAATAVVEAARDARAAAQAVQRQREGAMNALGDAAAALVGATADAARADALVDALRRAPTEIAQRQAAAFGDLGTVTIAFLDGGGVDVLLDGRPWWCASTGRQVVGDVWLRAGIRRALGLGWLPIIVDNTQAVGGQPLPDVGGPMILLRTTSDAGLVVRKIGARRAA